MRETPKVNDVSFIAFVKISLFVLYSQPAIDRANNACAHYMEIHPSSVLTSEYMKNHVSELRRMI